MWRTIIAAVALAALAACSGAEREDTLAGETPVAGAAATASSSASSSSTMSASDGQSAVRFAGSVSGNGIVRHSFTARQGQTITITRDGNAPMPYFNLMPPGGKPGDQLVVGMMHDGNRWTGTAPVTGTYTAELYLRGAAKDEGRTLPYALEVTVQ